MTDQPEYERPIEDRIRESITKKEQMLAGQAQPEKPKKRSKKS